MITFSNIKEVVSLLPDKDKFRIKNTDKEYGVLYLITSNSGSRVLLTLTNDFNRYKNVSNNGNVVLEVSDILSYLN